MNDDPELHHFVVENKIGGTSPPWVLHCRLAKVLYFSKSPRSCAPASRKRCGQPTQPATPTHETQTELRAATQSATEQKRTAGQEVKDGFDDSDGVSQLSQPQNGPKTIPT